MKNFSKFMIGGALFIEFLSISIGILAYKVIPEFLGFSILVGFLIVSIFLSLKFQSRTIAYYSVVGGIFTPLIGIIMVIIGLVLAFKARKINMEDKIALSAIIIGLVYFSLILLRIMGSVQLRQFSNKYINLEALYYQITN